LHRDNRNSAPSTTFLLPKPAVRRASSFYPERQAAGRRPTRQQEQSKQPAFSSRAHISGEGKIHNPLIVLDANRFLQ
jgi:hypothetical protein